MKGMCPMPLIYCVEDDESIRDLVGYGAAGAGIWHGRDLAVRMISTKG